jgi:hypothetical protein
MTSAEPRDQPTSSSAWRVKKPSSYSSSAHTEQPRGQTNGGAAPSWLPCRQRIPAEVLKALQHKTERGDEPADKPGNPVD